MSTDIEDRKRAEGSIVSALFVIQEVTERVHAEEASTRVREPPPTFVSPPDRDPRGATQSLVRELHDEFGQILAAVSLHLHATRAAAGDAAAPSGLCASVSGITRSAPPVRSIDSLYDCYRKNRLHCASPQD